MVLFPLFLDKDFNKHFCGYGVEQEFRHCFAELPSTSRFVALMDDRQPLEPMTAALRGR